MTTAHTQQSFLPPPPSSSQVEELFRAAEVYHDQALRHLRSIHTSHVGRRRADSRSTLPEAPTPPLRATSIPVFLSSDQSQSHLLPFPRPRSLTLETQERPSSIYPSPRPLLPVNTNPADGEYAIAGDHDVSWIPLLDTSNNSPTRPADETPYTREQLATIIFDDAAILQHLQGLVFDEDEKMGTVFKELFQRRDRGDLSFALSFRDFAAYEREGWVPSTFEVYDIAPNASVRKITMEDEERGGGNGPVKYGGDVPFESPEGFVDAPTVWETIRSVNPLKQSVGRITIVQEPTPLMLAALHLAMSPHFDMSELLQHLVSNEVNRGRTCAFMHRAFEQSAFSTCPLPPSVRSSSETKSVPLQLQSFAHLRQRSFFFVFKYYTVVSTDPPLEPASWQNYDRRPNHRRSLNHIDIAECDSILALSLGGTPTGYPNRKHRRGRVQQGAMFDTFAPWHVLSIQSFPDAEHTLRGEEFQQKSFYNGPYAFLDMLIAEYRDAVKRNMILNEKITKLIVPSPTFMFDQRLRDNLLFEDKHFTYIRRYFWAYNTLAVINAGIKMMVAAYKENFTPEFWEGNHPFLWPHPKPDSDKGIAYRAKMALLRIELERVVEELSGVVTRNERTRKEIENLREQLFTGSAIKESRRATDQGDNIRVLTMISMIFLPLTFVTSVWGMTQFDISPKGWEFPLTIVLVCVPFIVLIMLLSNRSFNTFIRKVGASFAFIGSFPRRLFYRVLGPEPEPARDNKSTIVLKGRKVKHLLLDESDRETRASWKMLLRWPWSSATGLATNEHGSLPVSKGDATGKAPGVV